MLRPFDIYPRLKHKKGQPSHRGYTLQDFLYTWNTLLPPESTMNRYTSRREPMPDPPPSSRTNAATVRAALETAASNSDAATPIFPNNDAGGNNLTTTREVYIGEPKSAPLGSPTRIGVVSVGAETAPSTRRPTFPD